jgi:hypothetical protein
MRHLYAVFVAVTHIKIAVEFANYKIIILNWLHTSLEKGERCMSLFCRDTTQRYVEQDEDLIYTITAVNKLHSVVCLTKGPKPLPKRAFHILRSRASTFK